MNVTYIILLVVCLSGLIIRTSYELCKKAGYIDTNNIYIFAVVFIGMCSMLLCWPFISYTDPVKINLPDFINKFGIGVSTAGFLLAISALLQLKKLENIEHLMTTGLFSKIRHPMYTGFILWISGWIIFYGAVVSLLAGIFSIANILYWRRLEEKNLELLFGENYRQYRRKTWF
jgi:protein-S-isoprenylcysteine O-methyltransferase Ste14